MQTKAKFCEKRKITKGAVKNSQKINYVYFFKTVFPQDIWTHVIIENI